MQYIYLDFNPIKISFQVLLTTGKMMWKLISKVLECIFHKIENESELLNSIDVQMSWTVKHKILTFSHLLLQIWIYDLMNNSN